MLNVTVGLIECISSNTGKCYTYDDEQNATIFRIRCSLHFF